MQLMRHLKHFIEESGFFPSFRVRKRAAWKYLRVNGLEIGAPSTDTKASLGTDRIYYIRTREEKIESYKEISAKSIVRTDIIDNGLVLSLVDNATCDFLVANHVLEHSQDPLESLISRP